MFCVNPLKLKMNGFTCISFFLFTEIPGSLCCCIHLRKSRKVSDLYSASVSPTPPHPAELLFMYRLGDLCD